MNSLRRLRRLREHSPLRAVHGGRIAIGAILLLAPCAAAKAQTCDGSASFYGGSLHVGATGIANRDAHAYALSAGVGMADGLWFSASLGGLHQYGLSDEGLTMGARVGYAQSILTRDRLQICPSLSYDIQDGPDQLAAVSSTQVATHYFDGRAMRLGVSLGSRASMYRRVVIVPTISGSLVLSKQRVTVLGQRFERDQGFFAGSAGVGFVLNEAWTLRSSVGMSFVDDRKATFSVLARYNFGPLWGCVEGAEFLCRR